MVFNFLSWFILVASNYLRIWGDEWAKESNEKDPHLQVKAFFFSNQVLLSSHRLDIYSLAGAHFFPATCMNSQATFWPQIRSIQNHLWCIWKTVFAFLLSFAKSLFSIFHVSLLVAWAQICAKVSFGHILNVVRSELWGNPAGISNCSPSEVFGVGPLSTLFFLRVCWQGTLCLYQTSCLDLAIWHQKKLGVGALGEVSAGTIPDYSPARRFRWVGGQVSRAASSRPSTPSLEHFRTFLNIFQNVNLHLKIKDQMQKQRQRCPEPLPPADLLLASPPPIKAVELFPKW